MNNTKRRKMLHNDQDGKCHYCKVEMTMKRGRDNSVTVDHKLPRAYGGRLNRRNIVGACWSCNNARGLMDYVTFVKFVEVHGRPCAQPGEGAHSRIKRCKRSAEAVAAENRIKAREGRWTRVERPSHAYVAEVGRYPVLGEMLVQAGIGPIPQSSISEVQL